MVKHTKTNSRRIVWVCLTILWDWRWKCKVHTHLNKPAARSWRLFKCLIFVWTPGLKRINILTIIISNEKVTLMETSFFDQCNCVRDTDAAFFYKKKGKLIEKRKKFFLKDLDDSLKCSKRMLHHQKLPFRDFLRKRCPENMQQIYRKTPMSKCDFSKITCNFIEIALRLDVLL